MGSYLRLNHLIFQNKIKLKQANTSSNKLNESSSIYAWGTLILLSMIWGSSFILIKKALIAFSPLEVGALRLSIATVAFIPYMVYHWKDISWERFRFFLLVGLAGSGIPAFLFAIAQTNVDSSVAGLLNSLTPIFTLIIGILIYRAKLIGKQVTGIVLGFLGAASLIFLKDGLNSNINVMYSLIIVLATLCYGTSVNVVNFKLTNLKPTMISSVAFMLTGPFALIYLCTTNVIDDVTNHPQGWMSLIAIIALSLLSTFYSTIVFYKLVQRTNPVFAASVSFLIPIVALIWAFLDGELVTVYHLLSLALILSGVYMIRRAKS